MAKGEKRSRIVAAAVRLLAERGTAGASLLDVVRAAGGARGSTYHHFPDGKRELYDAALDLASSHALAVLEPTRGLPAPEVVDTFFRMWRSLLAGSDMRLGCAVLAVAVGGEDAGNVAHAGQIFRSWRTHLADLLTAGGLSANEALELAALAIASGEGAVAIARAEGSLDGFEMVASRVVQLARDLT